MNNSRTTTENTFTNYDEFKKRTGLIDEDSKLIELGAAEFVGESDNGRFDTSLLAGLKNFCKKHPQFHIATLTSDSDDAESEELARRAAAKNLDWNKMDEDERESFRESEEIYALTIDNSIRFVNRMDYYLADGSADENLFLQEISD